MTLPNLTTMDPGMRNAYSRQASVEVEQQIGRRGTVSVGYQYVRGLDLIISINQNVPSCVAVGTNNGCRPDPRYGNNSRYSPMASSAYHGLHVSFVQRPVRWGYYRIGYTLSKAMDVVDDDGGGYAWPQESQFSRNYALAGFDRTHALQMGFVYELPFARNSHSMAASVSVTAFR